jgi:hypothetical protein
MQVESPKLVEKIPNPDSVDVTLVSPNEACGPIAVSGLSHRLNTTTVACGEWDASADFHFRCGKKVSRKVIPLYRAEPTHRSIAHDDERSQKPNGTSLLFEAIGLAAMLCGVRSWFFSCLRRAILLGGETVVRCR